MAQRKDILQKITDNIEKVLFGKREVIELMICAFLCGGHVLIEDVPGVGKTSLASALARSFSCSFTRIQFTPDIMPSDITGFNMYNPKTGEFEYKEGLVMAQIILADEINRTPPKTQSSLMEIMEENQKTVDGKTYPMPSPFIVLATQNPVEYTGTYPLPEAQLDRFFMRISIGYPAFDIESDMLTMLNGGRPLDEITAVADADDLIKLQSELSGIYTDKKINDYIISIINNTRINTDIMLGASPRASFCLFRAAQAWAMYSGRDYVIPDDVIKMAHPVLEHRLVLKQEAKMKKITTETVVRTAVENVKVPV
ncbi:MAG: MoxR family ATPase [Oscillospiraceae bacterium]|nr:MoxR family ATPase [Oscillospiraceae bacterium]